MERSGVFGVLLVALQLLGCGSDDAESEKPGSLCPEGAPRPAVALTKIDRSRLTNLGTAPLDYSDPNLWLCRPGNDPNECHANLDATEILKDNTRKTVERRPAKNTAFDCFYVYPTVSIGGTGNVQDFTDISPTLDPLLNQAAPFAGLCEIFAPLYRQVSIGLASGGITGAGDVELAFADVVAAFQYYVDHLNQGRKFVLMGHSQGTLTLTRLVSQRIDADPTLRANLISALLIGGAVIVPQGQRLGGSFQNIPACASAGETGCVIAYATFPAEAPPPATSIFGRTTAPGSEVICSPLGELAQNPGRFRGSYQPLAFVNPLFRPQGTLPDGITTPFVVYRDFFRGECTVSDGAHYLAVSIDRTADDQRPDPPYRSAGQETIGFGLHVADYNLALDDLVEIVTLQAKAAGVSGCPPG